MIKVTVITPTIDLDRQLILCARSVVGSDLDELDIRLEHLFIIDGGRIDREG